MTISKHLYSISFLENARFVNKCNSERYSLIKSKAFAWSLFQDTLLWYPMFFYTSMSGSVNLDMHGNIEVISQLKALEPLYLAYRLYNDPHDHINNLVSVTRQKRQVAY